MAVWSAPPENLGAPLVLTSFVYDRDCMEVPSSRKKRSYYNALDDSLFKASKRDLGKGGTEYLHSLQQNTKRKHEKNLQLGKLVNIKNPIFHPSGRIPEVHPSDDMSVQAVTVRTS
ncbi:hypothetical protein CEXT_391121 [Caerostris extrusa]|uniref:DUF5641 domain-containing protein n=1 Tax=Caerostris extrusa TaxID=172846 RepID=A0AAV4Y311_CAEEX|nr:hypothetical protein CEXT_391121 [Caerostris extrusa]